MRGAQEEGEAAVKMGVWSVEVCIDLILTDRLSDVA